MPRREYVGNAPATTLNGAITAVSATIVITDGTNWPTGAVGPFVVIIDRGAAAEEKVLITSRSGNTLTVSSRGFDSTTAASHANGATIEHGLSAIDIDEVNDHVFDTSNDDHTQYLNNARHDVEARHTFTAGLGTPAAPAELGHGAASAGSGDNPAREDHVHSHNPPACRLTKSADQSISDNTLTAITWNQETFDTDSMHDNVTNNSRITFNTAGVYEVKFYFGFAGQATLQWIEGRIRLNGVTSLAGATSDRNGVGFGPVGVVTVLYKFAANDYVEAIIYQDNTDNVAVNFLAAPSPGATSFSAVWVGTGV